MTHPSLVGYNEPERDRAKRVHLLTQMQTAAKTVEPTGSSGTRPKRTRIRSYKDQCIETLIAYRKYVSHNFGALHRRYAASVAAVGLIPNNPPDDNKLETASQLRIYMLASSPSLLCELLYYDMYDRSLRQIVRFKRGESWCWTEDSYLYLIITPITFNLSVSLKRATDVGVL